ncbi:hypothetical protein C3486_22170 [Streptomyces sp. Ru73]|uniref:hypothetical protein n=1 Tax=Streptomyces sp. Ru73 TaxID=2080748 RepID=UPI000CDD0646|nr:hypothetical protein [Streptomyces sp. Ru73]POX38622.1 hypothetical protein C3486_22170 [Streptomyces sp. Ru73]
MSSASQRPAHEDAPPAPSEEGTRAASGEETPAASPEEPFAECVLCRAPTEYPESTPGIVLCPPCEWLEAQRTACSG